MERTLTLHRRGLHSSPSQRRSSQLRLPATHLHSQTRAHARAAATRRRPAARPRAGVPADADARTGQDAPRSPPPRRPSGGLAGSASGDFGSFTMGPLLRSEDRPPRSPLPRFPPAARSARDRWGEGGEARRRLPLSLRAGAGPGPHARARPPPARGTRAAWLGLRRGPPAGRDQAAEDRPRRGERQRRGRPGRSYAPPAPQACGPAPRTTAPDSARGPAKRSGSPSPRTFPAGARPERTLTHTRCTLAASPAPPLCRALRTPRTLRGPHPESQPAVPCSGGTGPPSRPHPGGWPCRVPSAAQTPRARPDTRRGGRGGAGTGTGTGERGRGTPHTRHYHPFCGTKGCRRSRRPRATYQWLSAPPPAPGPGPRTPRQGRRGAGLRREMRAEAADRARRVPAPLPPRSEPATARRSPRLLHLLSSSTAAARLPAASLSAEAQPVSAEPASRALLPPREEGRAEGGAGRPEKLAGAEGLESAGRRGSTPSQPKACAPAAGLQLAGLGRLPLPG